MRSVFFEQLRNMMHQDEGLFLVVADMGLGIVEHFQREFPKRFINVGIAEQNMIGICAGLCNVGFRPICYTISNFLTQRCFEQIRNDVCLHNYPVVLVGTSTGFDNGKLGPTHQVIDDIGCIKILPNITIYSPSTTSSIQLILKEIMEQRKPAYVRIGKGAFDLRPPVNDINQMVVKGKQQAVLIITYGNILENCIKVADADSRISIYCMNKIKPVERDIIDLFFQEYANIVVVEEHFARSGLYNTLCQYLIELGTCKTKLYSIALPEIYEERVGDKNFFADKYGFTPEKINEFIFNLLSS